MIVTHTNPDWDAIAAVWCVSRLGGVPSEPVRFVAADRPDPAILASADAVVDCGGQYDPSRFRFDHHGCARPGAAKTSSAELAYRALGGLEKAPYLQPVIDLIADADGRDVAAERVRWSYTAGLHVLLAGWKALASRLAPDERDAELVRRGLDVLDAVSLALEQRWRCRRNQPFSTIAATPDYRFVALKNIGVNATFAAFDRGAEIVLFLDDRDRDRTVVCGIRRSPTSTVSCADIVDAAIRIAPDVAPELLTWFRHPDGFFAGRGTEKAPDPTPLRCDEQRLVNAITAACQEVLSRSLAPPAARRPTVS